MAHQAVNLIYRDDARLLVDQAVTADGAQNLCVRQRLQDRVAFQFVETEDTRLNSATAGQIHVGRAVEEFCLRSRTSTQASNLIRKTFSNLPDGFFIPQARQDIADHSTGRRKFRADFVQIGEAAI